MLWVESLERKLCVLTPCLRLPSLKCLNGLLLTRLCRFLNEHISFSVLSPGLKDADLVAGGCHCSFLREIWQKRQLW